MLEAIEKEKCMNDYMHTYYDADMYILYTYKFSVYTGILYCTYRDIKPSCICKQIIILKILAYLTAKSIQALPVSHDVF